MRFSSLTVIAIVAMVGWHFFPIHDTDYPPDESAFLATVQGSMDAWGNAANDAQRDPMRARRDQALCATSMDFSGWKGVAKAPKRLFLDSTYGIEVELADGIQLRMLSGIERGSKLFEQIEPIEDGEDVVVSGRFKAGFGTCLFEGSTTMSGGMTEPEFNVTFDSVATPLRVRPQTASASEAK